LKDDEGQLLFQPDRKADFAVSSFGLRVTAAIPVKREEVETVKEVPVIKLAPVKPDVKAADDPERETGTSRYWMTAAIAALLITAGGLGLVNSDLNSSTQFGDLWPFGDTTGIYEEREAAVQEVLQEDTASEVSVATIEPGQVDLDITADEVLRHPVLLDIEEVEPVSTYVEPAVVKGPYHVVIGCFSVKENATKLIAKYEEQGFSPRVLDEHRGLFRVTLDSYSAKQEAIDELRAVRRLGSQDAWLLVK